MPATIPNLSCSISTLEVDVQRHDATRDATVWSRRVAGHWPSHSAIAISEFYHDPHEARVPMYFQFCLTRRALDFTAHIVNMAEVTSRHTFSLHVC